MVVAGKDRRGSLGRCKCGESKGGRCMVGLSMTVLEADKPLLELGTIEVAVRLRVTA